MKNKFLKGFFASIALAASGLANAGIIFSEVSDNAYITVDGYDIAWAGPCAVTDPSCGALDFSYQAQFGWRAMDSVLFAQLGISAWDFVFAGANVDYFTGNNLDELSGASVSALSGTLPDNDVAVAAPWFASSHNHIDWSDGSNGLWSFSDINNEGWYDSLAVRASTQIPEPSTLAVFALGLMGLASRKFKKQA